MAFLIGGANTTSDEAYSVANSCRFDDGDSAYMAKTPGSAGNRRKFTISCWVKRGSMGAAHKNIFSSGTYGTTQLTQIFFESDDKLHISDYTSGQSLSWKLETNRLFRDPSAWYSIIIAVDTEQGTAANRVKMYINGTQETSFATETYPDEDFDCAMNLDHVHTVGNRNGASLYFDGYIAEFVLIDGTQYAATSFGEFNEDSPTIWQPIDVSGLTFGTNGFYLDFEASGNLGNDANGGTDLGETNVAAADQATDTPTNNFATFNPLASITDAPTFSEGNCKIAIGSAGQFGACSTIGLTAGKWYAEFVKSVTSDNDMCVGIISDLDDAISDNHPGHSSNSYSYRETGVSITGASESSYGDSYDTDDVIGVALNLDDNELTFYKDNTVQNSGTAISITAAASTITGAYFLTASCSSASQSGTWDANFGGCSAFTLASAANDENGYGNFEFAPPSGFLAICTKNLGSDGG